MRPSRCVTGSVVGLDDARLGVDQGEDALAGRQPRWNWLQNEAMLVSGNQKMAMLCTNRYHCPAETVPSSTCRPPK